MRARPKISEKEIRELITELYPIEKSESPFLLVFQVAEIVKVYNDRKLNKWAEEAEQEIKELKDKLKYANERIEFMEALNK